MTHFDLKTRGDLPPEWQILLREHPRDSRPGNPNFTASIQHWLGAHQMFRDLARITQDDSETFLDGNSDEQEYIARLGHLGNHLVRNLHGHHTWEDHSFFPEMMDADGRFVDGLEMLEGDHQQLDGLLDQFVDHANRAIKLHTLDPAQVRDAVGAIREDSAQLQGFLHRHLSDEEELAVPVLLHYKLRS